MVSIWVRSVLGLEQKFTNWGIAYTEMMERWERYGKGTVKDREMPDIVREIWSFQAVGIDNVRVWAGSFSRAW